MQPSPKPMKGGLDPYRMRQRPLTVEEIAEIAAHLHIAHLTELHRLRDLQRRFDWPLRQDHVQYVPKPRKQLRLSSRLDHLPNPALVTWRPVVVPRNLQELFDTVPKPQTNVSGEGEGGAGGAGGAAGAGAWRAARGWAAGALLLLAALCLVRATDRFFARSLARWRRSRSEEWPTPNVLATSHRSTFIDVELPSHHLDAIPSESSGSSQELYTSDLPPPYSECHASHAPKHKYEEPPPPYSACYVEFSNPKDGMPSVHFLNGQRQNIFQDADASTSTAGHESGQYPKDTPSVNFLNNQQHFQCLAGSSREARLEDAGQNHKDGIPAVHFRNTRQLDQDSGPSETTTKDTNDTGQIKSNDGEQTTGLHSERSATTSKDC